MAATDKPVVLCDDRMIPLKTITFGGYVQKCVDHDGLAPDHAPERRRSFHEPLLKGGHVGIPEDLQGHLRAEGDALRASNAGIEVITRVGFWRKDGRPRRANLGTKTATGALSRRENGMCIRVHPLLLGAQGQSHGDVLYRPAKCGFHMSFEVRKNDVTVGLLDDPSDVNLGKMPIIARDFYDITAVGTIADHDGAAEVFFGEAVLGSRF